MAARFAVKPGAPQRGGALQGPQAGQRFPEGVTGRRQGGGGRPAVRTKKRRWQNGSTAQVPCRHAVPRPRRRAGPALPVAWQDTGGPIRVRAAPEGRVGLEGGVEGSAAGLGLPRPGDPGNTGRREGRGQGGEAGRMKFAGRPKSGAACRTEDGARRGGCASEKPGRSAGRFRTAPPLRSALPLPQPAGKGGADKAGQDEAGAPFPAHAPRSHPGRGRSGQAVRRGGAPASARPARSPHGLHASPPPT